MSRAGAAQLRYSFIVSALFWGMTTAGGDVSPPQQPESVYVQQLRSAASDSALPSPARFKNSIALADYYRQQGRHRAALEVVDAAGALAADDSSRAQFALQRGTALFGIGRFDEAGESFADAESLSAALSINEQIALSVAQGNLAAERGEFAGAFAKYDVGATRAADANLVTSEALARVNYLRARVDGKYLADLQEAIRKAQRSIGAVPPGDEQARLYLSLGESIERAIRELAQPAAWRSEAFDAFNRAKIAATRSETLGYANGFLGGLYESDQRIDEALTLTRRALFYAQQASATEQTYLWEWQLGRLQLAQGKRDEAEGALSRAVELLGEVKSNFALGSRATFNTRVAPVYVQYADLMLARASTEQDNATKQDTLKEVRDLLEKLKRAEVEDYFGNPCVARFRSRAVSVTDATAAVIYPVMLPDRLELLVETNGTLAQFTVPVSRNQLTQVIRGFRRDLERPFAGDDYLASSRTLYGWLVAPFDSYLRSNGTKTLVWVPDGALRTIPPAALNDGSQFLIAKYAIALTPALQLTEGLTRPAVESVLIGGLTKGVRGYAPLPAVGEEIDRVSAIYPMTRPPMRDETFQLKAVSDELRGGDFSVAHFATHGEFSSDYRRSYILTFDDQLTLNGLRTALEQRKAEKNLDLLVLSACKTAAGDDRAALGLAGVAVQSGAQSALASLWYVSDAASAALIDEFYQRLHEGASTKAESLRAAQLALLKNRRFQHPSYWAPYLLVGNWL